MAIIKFKLIGVVGVLTALSILAWTYSQTVQKLEAAQALIVEQQTPKKRTAISLHINHCVYCAYLCGDDPYKSLF
ncbi:hypothetical protein [Photobacterium phosphoreum]|uniref:hypothetical protein n=1 Tax=Photobacterium phosphoreum TaxID=659 RepID=UPI000D1616F0|nr:hypothetical protein [Photobacterium phosphoreum]PTB32032.1 hypothetical protein DAT36_14040 [Photobacterium phosphoreum]